MGAGAFISGAAIGAGMMYLLDPEMGTRRRALLRDKLVHTMNVTSRAIDKSQHDLANRACGVVAETRAMLRSESVSDDVLVDRVRSEMGHAISHVHSITATADNGVVTLSGPILAREVAGLLRAVSSVRGVRSIRNRLDIHEAAGNIPDVQHA